MKATKVFGLLIAVLLVVTPVAVNAFDGKQSLEDGIGKSLTLFKTWTTPNYGGTTVRISNHGNITKYESPTGYDHIGVGTVLEGYVLCYKPLSWGPDIVNYDLGSIEAGFGSPFSVVVEPASMIRKTTDGRTSLKQSFSFSGTNRTLTITMTVKNLTLANLYDVVLRRHVDFDIDTGGIKGWNSSFKNLHASDTKVGVFAWNDPSEAPAGIDSHAMSLKHLTAGPLNRSAKVTSNIADTTCSPASVATYPVPDDDYGDTIQYNIGLLAPGASRVVTVQYERF